jgi:hypothetical protein
MTPTTPVQDLPTQWNSARRLYPIYFELAREFAIEMKPCAELEAGVDTPEKEVVEQANHWLEQMDQLVQVHQLRQFLQTSPLGDQEGLEGLLEHFLAKQAKTDIIRDKIDFLLVQYFSQLAPSGVTDADVDLAYVAEAMKPVLGVVELKPPVWLNALDRVLEACRKCRSLDELLHGGVLEQGRKAKGLAGDLFYLPVAMVAFTRFGYLMRRSFFRLMLGDLNGILDGLTELEEKGIQTIDCRRAQFSAQEPIVRLRVICQSWKVMFQAEYSSGQPLRMLVDLRASVEYALGRGKPPEAEAKTQGTAKAVPAAKPAPAAKAAPEVKAAPEAKAVPPAAKPAAKPAVAAKPAPVAAKPAASAAAAGATAKAPATKAVAPAAKLQAKPVSPPADAPPANEPEFEVSSTPGWDPESPSPSKKK